MADHSLAQMTCQFLVLSIRSETTRFIYQLCMVYGIESTFLNKLHRDRNETKIEHSVCSPRSSYGRRVTSCVSVSSFSILSAATTRSICYYTLVKYYIASTRPTCHASGPRVKLPSWLQHVCTN